MTAMSSRRSSSIISARQASVPAATGGSKIGIAVISLIAGLLILALGVKLDVTAIMGVGFTVFACALMYLNAMFWAYMYESGKMRMPSRRTPPPGI